MVNNNDKHHGVLYDVICDHVLLINTKYNTTYIWFAANMLLWISQTATADRLTKAMYVKATLNIGFGFINMIYESTSQSFQQEKLISLFAMLHCAALSVSLSTWRVCVAGLGFSTA